MRVVLITDTFLPKIDGIVTTICHVLDHLAVRGVEAMVLAPSGGPTVYAGMPVRGWRGYTVPLYGEVQLVPPTVNLTRTLQAFQPDLVHLFNPVSLGLAGLRQAKRINIPVVASYHTDLPGFLRRWHLPFLAAPTRAFLRWIHNQADLNLVPSEATRHELEDTGFERLGVWPHGVDTIHFHPKHREPAWRNWLTQGQDEWPLLLYVGRLSPEKQIERLRPLLDHLPRTRLAIVGDGPARRRLEKLFAGTPTVFTGYLRGRDLAQTYASADLFVSPAANETFGCTVSEAMASGLPVVTVNAGGPTDFVRHGETGWLAEPDNEAALLAGVRHLLQDKPLRKKMGAAARAHAETMTWSAVCDLLLQTYHSLSRTVPPDITSTPSAILSSAE